MGLVDHRFALLPLMRPSAEDEKSHSMPLLMSLPGTTTGVLEDDPPGVSTRGYTGAIIASMFAHLRRAVASRPLAADSLLAIVVAVFIGLGAVLRTGGDGSTGQVMGLVFLVTAALALAVRRKNPYLCLVATLALAIPGYALSDPFPPAILPAAVALYSVGTFASGRSAVIVACGALAPAIGFGFMSSDQMGIARSLVFGVAWVVGSLALGFAIGNRRAYVEQMRQRAIQAERMKEEEAQHRVDEERMRIARDVHDGVAHALASISIQASAGSAVLDRDPEGARQAFSAIRAASGSALSELRSTLGLLRHDDDGPAAEGMDREQLQRLTAVLRAEGIRVRALGEESAWTLKGEAGDAVHRILQESLTNVLRHSGATEVDVAIDRGKERIILTVTDNGRGMAAESGETRGYGLVGMRERASVIGGSVESGPRREGGFRVRAMLPLQDGL
ncbi:MAG: sensor histidine kinase [Thermoleophilia bacterium]|nr:sensor histidine kinase [Thermoleophilia bacterium]